MSFSDLKRATNGRKRCRFQIHHKKCLTFNNVHNTWASYRAKCGLRLCSILNEISIKNNNFKNFKNCDTSIEISDENSTTEFNQQKFSNFFLKSLKKSNQYNKLVEKTKGINFTLLPLILFNFKFQFKKLSFFSNHRLVSTLK